MKILKPGKVEQRKFVCPKCGCVFLAFNCDSFYGYVDCPQEGCYEQIEEDRGKPYEEPAQDKENDFRRLTELLDKLCGHTVDVPAQTLAIELLAHGVTFREG